MYFAYLDDPRQLNNRSINVGFLHEHQPPWDHTCFQILRYAYLQYQQQSANTMYGLIYSVSVNIKISEYFCVFLISRTCRSLRSYRSPFFLRPINCTQLSMNDRCLSINNLYIRHRQASHIHR